MGKRKWAPEDYGNWAFDMFASTHKYAEWVRTNGALASSLFPRHLGRHAATVAALHPYAIDYIRQAPIIVICDHTNGPWRPWAAHSNAFENGHKLRDLLDALNIPHPLRALKGMAFSCGWEIGSIRELRRFEPHVLSQIIPRTASEQANWIELLYLWHSHYTARAGARDDPHFEWAAMALAGRRGWTDVATVADWLIAHPDIEPDRPWAWAEEQAREWHNVRQHAAQGDRFLMDHGISYDQEIDYAPFLNHIQLGEYTLAALRSGKALAEEGRAMHHCVGSYARDVIEGKSRIYSIRNRENERVATMELRGEEGLVRDERVDNEDIYDIKVTWRLYQIKAACNAKPPTELLELLAKVGIK